MFLYFLFVYCTLYVFGLVNGNGVHVIKLQSYRSSTLPTYEPSKLISEEGGEESSEEEGENSVSPLPSNNYGPGSARLNSFNDVLWYTTITIGTGAGQKQLKVDVDTGSSDLFIPGAVCPNSCGGHTTYDPTTSPTSRRSLNNFTLSFADESSVAGFIYADDVALGGLVVKQHAFGVASVYSKKMEKPIFEPDGLLGLGFSTLSRLGTPPLIDNLYNQQKIKQRIFGVRLDRSGADGEQGELTLGGYNEEHIQGNIAYAPVTSEGFWQVEFDQMTVGNRVVASKQKFVVDTGSTLINANKGFARKIYSSIPGAHPEPNSKYWILPCANIPTLEITIGGTKFTIDPSTFSPGPVKESSHLCYGGIVANVGTNEPWIMGGVFLTNVYSIFDVDQKRVGFSQLKARQPLDQ